MRNKQLFISTVLFSLSANLIFAIPSSAATPTLAVNQTSIMPKTIDYTLPYPGLLPDNPLYPLKAARDRIISWFISDPVKKARFDLLQSDKRVNSSLYLYNENSSKQDLIITTLSKAENYFEEGIGQLHQGKTQGEDIRDTVRLYSKASQKYYEVIKRIETKAKGNFLTNLQDNDKRIIQLENAVAKMEEK